MHPSVMKYKWLFSADISCFDNDVGSLNTLRRFQSVTLIIRGCMLTGCHVMFTGSTQTIAGRGRFRTSRGPCRYGGSVSSYVAVFSSHVTVDISVSLSRCFVGSKVFSGIRFHYVFSLSSYAVTSSMHKCSFSVSVVFFSVLEARLQMSKDR